MRYLPFLRGNVGPDRLTRNNRLACMFAGQARLPLHRCGVEFELNHNRLFWARSQQPAPTFNRRDNAGAHQVVPNFRAHIRESRLAELLL